MIKLIAQCLYLLWCFCIVMVLHLLGTFYALVFEVNGTVESPLNKLNYAQIISYANSEKMLMFHNILVYGNSRIVRQNLIVGG